MISGGPSGSATRGAVIFCCLQLTYPNMCNAVKSSYLSLISASIFNTIIPNSGVTEHRRFRYAGNPVGQRGAQTYRVPNFVVSSIGLDSLLLTEGRTLRETEVTSLIITKGGPDWFWKTLIANNVSKNMLTSGWFLCKTKVTHIVQNPHFQSTFP
jgi:hypothetical protein